MKERDTGVTPRALRSQQSVHFIFSVSLRVKKWLNRVLCAGSRVCIIEGERGREISGPSSFII